jgi:hypothetical protein
LRWRAKAPWEQPPRGFNIPAALITKTERTACLSLTDLAENRYIFPQLFCPGSEAKTKDYKQNKVKNSRMVTIIRYGNNRFIGSYNFGDRLNNLLT